MKTYRDLPTLKLIRIINSCLGIDMGEDLKLISSLSILLCKPKGRAQLGESNLSVRLVFPTASDQIR